MEEIARFALDDGDLTAEFKNQRHGLVSALKRVSRHSLLRARNTGEDVGTEISETLEYVRTDLAHVVAAAAARTQQLFRVLEEYAKTLNPQMSADLEQIRYRCYTASADLELRVAKQAVSGRLETANLYALVSCGSSHADFLAKVEQLLDGPVDIIQLRDRDADDRTLISRARAGTEIARRFGKLFIMNDRADLAMAADTDGVHVGQQELSVADARKIVGDRMIGVSTHSIEQARDADRWSGLHWLWSGIFEQTKCFTEFVGTKFLVEVVNEIRIPAAIGGVDLSNVEQVVETGLRRIVVTGLFAAKIPFGPPNS